MLTHYFIQRIIDKYRESYPEVTKCQHSFEFVSYCLETKKLINSYYDVVPCNRSPYFTLYIDDYSSEDTICKYIKPINSREIRDNIRKALQYRGYCSIGLDINPNHYFVLVLVYSKTYIIDSYHSITTKRGIDIRKINIERIIEMVGTENPTERIHIWNELFKCNETINNDNWLGSRVIHVS